MTKGKAHSRGSRLDIMRSNEKNARRKAREKARARAKGYDHRSYDGAEGGRGS
jgi:hypothetical protein